MAAGFALKTYWRQVHARGAWHYFSRADRGHGFISACRCATVYEIGGQKKLRPPCVLRCSTCDRAEMRMHGVTESVE